MDLTDLDAVPNENPASPLADLICRLFIRAEDSKLGRIIRSTINRMIGAEVRAGRLGTDWQKVWRTTRPAKDAENVP